MIHDTLGLLDAPAEKTIRPMVDLVENAISLCKASLNVPVEVFRSKQDIQVHIAPSASQEGELIARGSFRFHRGSRRRSRNIH